MRFTAESESLFLLDEPDTHLNPRWSVDYLKYLEAFIGRSEDGEESSHVVMTTHNPLAVAELLRDQVQILSRNKDTQSITAQAPELNPRGMGYAGVITSELFGLDAAVDSHTLALLDEKRQLSSMESLDAPDRERLNTLNKELLSYGFRFEMRDPVYTEYLKARYAESEKTESTGMAHRDRESEMMRAKQLVEDALRSIEDEES